MPLYNLTEYSDNYLETNLILTWSPNCVTTSTAVPNEVQHLP